MKNAEIIADAAVRAGILTEEEAKRRLELGEDIPLHTIGWYHRRDNNYRIKDGEEGIEVKLWRRKEDGSGFYLAKSILYHESQLYVECE